MREWPECHAGRLLADRSPRRRVVAIGPLGHSPGALDTRSGGRSAKGPCGNENKAGSEWGDGIHGSERRTECRNMGARAHAWRSTWRSARLGSKRTPATLAHIRAQSRLSGSSAAAPITGAGAIPARSVGLTQRKMQLFDRAERCEDGEQQGNRAIALKELANMLVAFPTRHRKVFLEVRLHAHRVKFRFLSLEPKCAQPCAREQPMARQAQQHGS